LLAAALGTCIGVYVTRYCNEAGIDCSGLTVEVSHAMTEDMARIGKMHAKVRIPGGVPENRRAAVKKVAGHCLIHQTLCTQPEMLVELE
ncbi:MAG: OsmC family protein, partial [Armatimonadota bacterium]